MPGSGPGDAGVDGSHKSAARMSIGRQKTSGGRLGAPVEKEREGIVVYARE